MALLNITRTKHFHSVPLIHLHTHTQTLMAVELPCKMLAWPSGAIKVQFLDQGHFDMFTWGTREQTTNPDDDQQCSIGPPLSRGIAEYRFEKTVKIDEAETKIS